MTKGDVYSKLFFWGVWALTLLAHGYYRAENGNALFLGWCSGSIMGILFCMTVLDLREIRRRNDRK